MTRRQAAILFFSLPLLAGLFACAPRPQAFPTPTPLPPTPAAQLLLPTADVTRPPAPTPTSTPLTCLDDAGHVEEGSIPATRPSQDYLIYLPPCYAGESERRYPVLYLLHGQTYTADQWIRLGAVEVANRLIQAQEAPPFIIVFPDDHYWNLPAGPGFGQRLVDVLIPYIDEHYRTLQERPYRALGGLSRGGGWTLRLGLTQWQLFGSIGLHSPAIFSQDAALLQIWIADLPPAEWPRLWFDIGDRDKELAAARQLESLLSAAGVPHEFHLYSGDHSEAYWQRHVEEYLRWYVAAWTGLK
jgi:enterochelin esterase-like enzyme